MSQRDADPAAISIEEIAATRYAYPTEDRPTWQTIIAGQEPADAPSIAPADLAVFDSETNELVLAAVVVMTQMAVAVEQEVRVSKL